MLYAIDHPQSIEKLILVSPCPASSEEYAACDKEWTVRMAPYQQEIEAIKVSHGFAEGDPAVTDFMREKE
jgi:hypothetical protein